MNAPADLTQHRFNDKRNLLSSLSTMGRVDLELGCANLKRNPNAIGIDMLDFEGVDVVGDVYEVLAAFPTASVDSVYASHFIEHVPDLQGLLSELARVVKPGGQMELIAPHFSNPYFYSDPTHRSFFGLYTFAYLAQGSPFSRQVPTYDYDLKFSLERVDLGFKSPRPFYVRYAIKRLQGLVFNSSNYLREFWEENLCWLCPAYEVTYRLRRV